MTLSLQLPSACKSLWTPLPCGLRQVPSGCPRTKGTNLYHPITAQVLSHRSWRQPGPESLGMGWQSPSQSHRPERQSGVIEKKTCDGGHGTNVPSSPQAGSFLGGSRPWCELVQVQCHLCLWLRGVGAEAVGYEGNPWSRRSGVSHSAPTDLFGEGLTAEVTGWGHAPRPAAGKRVILGHSTPGRNPF